MELVIRNAMWAIREICVIPVSKKTEFSTLDQVFTIAQFVPKKLQTQSR